jgi:hypothetical protein
MEGLDGVIAKEERLAAFTVRGAFPVTSSKDAEIVVVPTLKALASPLTVIEATPVADEFHTTEPVMFCVDESEKVPVAVNCCAIPIEMFAFAGVTTMETTVAEVTVSVAEPVTEPEVAEMDVVPVLRAFTIPSVGAELLTVATDGFDDAQVTLPVRFCVLPSL